MPNNTPAPADLVEAVRDVLNHAHYLLDDTANDNPPEVPQDSWDNLAKAVETLEGLIPEGEQPCIIGVAARLISADTPKLDPRDAEISALQGEVKSLHHSILACANSGNSSCTVKQRDTEIEQLKALAGHLADCLALELGNLANEDENEDADLHLTLGADYAKQVIAARLRIRQARTALANSEGKANG